jgi:hypothetical protein
MVLALCVSEVILRVAADSLQGVLLFLFFSVAAVAACQVRTPLVQNDSPDIPAVANL